MNFLSPLLVGIDVRSVDRVLDSDLHQKVGR
jgi:hypothetical protein